MIKLLADVLTQLAVTAAGAPADVLAQQEGFLAGAEAASAIMVGGKPVAEVLEGELEAFGKTAGIAQGLGLVGEKGSHLPGVLEVAFGIGGEEGAGLVEGGVVAEAGEGVGEEAVPAGGEERGVGSEERQSEVFRQIAELSVAAFLAPDVVTGERDVEVPRAESIPQAGGALEKAAACCAGDGFRGEEGDQSPGVRVEEVAEGSTVIRRLLLRGGRGVAVQVGEQAAEIAVAGAIPDEDRHLEKIPRGAGHPPALDGGADEGAETAFPGGGMGAGGSVNPHVIRDGDGVVADLRGAADEVLRLAGTAKEGEATAGVEFGEHSAGLG